MKKKSGFGFRVSGTLYQLSLTWAILLFCGFIVSATGQELKYKFNKGQILQYQYNAKCISDTGAQNENGIRRLNSFLYIFEFHVDSISRSGAFMTLTPRQYSQTGSTQYKNSPPHIVKKSFIEGESDAVATAYYGDLNRTINFHINSDGQLSQFKGVEKIFNDVAALFQSEENVPLKGKINFNWLKLRYSDDYYRILIRQFLPVLPGRKVDAGTKDNDISLSHLNDKLSSGFHWTQIYPDPFTGNIKFSNLLTVTKALQPSLGQKAVLGNKTQTSTIGNSNGLAHWDEDNGFMDTLKFQGTDLPHLLLSWVNEDLHVWHGYAGNIEIFDIKIALANFSRNNWTTLDLEIRDADSMEMELRWPTDMFLFRKADRIKITRNPFRLSLGTKVDQPELVDIYFHRSAKPDGPGQKVINDILDYNQILNPDKIRLYVQPGDSLKVSMSLNGLKDATFEGPHAGENRILSQLFRFSKIDTRYTQLSHNGRVVQIEREDTGLPIRVIPEKILECLQEDEILLKSSRAGMNPKFHDRINFEIQYLKMGFELSALHQNSAASSNKNLKDTLRYYQKFLGREDHRGSMAYLGFIKQYVLANLWNAGINEDFEGKSAYRSTEIFLQGWDRYQALANIVMSNLKNFDQFDYEDNYKSFMDDYEKTAYGQHLSSEHTLTRYFDDASQIAKLDLEPYIGDPVIVVIDYKKSQDFIRTFIREKLYLNRSRARLILYLKDEEKSELLEQMQILTGSAETNLSVLTEGYFLTVRKMTDYLSAISRLNNPKILFFDRYGKFISYFRGQYDELKINNILSWPQLTPTPAKTVSLKVFWYSLTGSFILSILIILALRFRSVRKQSQLILKRKMAQLEADAVRSRMNPHFLFNALSSIQNLINKNQIEEANLFLARFGNLVRTILNQSSMPAIGLNEEIDMIRHYLQLEQLRFPFKFNIQIDPSLDPYAIEVPPLLIQPHVENAVIHGISGMGAEGIIEISFRIEDRHLICQVKDNGPGYHPEIKTANGGLGQGWKLTRQRIQLMKEQFGDDVSVEVQGMAQESERVSDSSGTTVIFRLPLQNAA